jgi:hypothetical protein
MLPLCLERVLPAQARAIEKVHGFLVAPPGAPEGLYRLVQHEALPERLNALIGALPARINPQIGAPPVLYLCANFYRAAVPFQVRPGKLPSSATGSYRNLGGKVAPALGELVLLLWEGYGAITWAERIVAAWCRLQPVAALGSLVERPDAVAAGHGDEQGASADG